MRTSPVSPLLQLSQRIDLPIMLTDMSVSGATPNTLPFPPLSDPKLATTDTLLAITSLQTALETHGLLDKGMVDHGAEQMVGKSLPDNAQRLQLGGLPVEIHEAILDHLFGVRASTSSCAAKGSQATRGWSNVLRHPRRKQLSNLGLVSPLWRRLVQERLYRHSKSLVGLPTNQPFSNHQPRNSQGQRYQDRTSPMRGMVSASPASPIVRETYRSVGTCVGKEVWPFAILLACADQPTPNPVSGDCHHHRQCQHDIV